jgi:CO dehydrogenase maturation factor
MRIAFLGKGGAGKTTTAAGFVKFVAQRFPFVLAIDADVNAHLLTALDLPTVSGEKHELGEVCEQIFDFLRGKRTDLGNRPIVGTTPPSLLSNFVTVQESDSFVSQYALRSGNIALLTVGTYKESDVGGSCYHTKLRGLAGIMHHMLDRPSDIVVADTTAGTDNVATSLSFAYDLNVFVVEPTLKSLKVYGDFLAIAPQLADRVYVIANKIESEEDKAFIYSHVPGDKVMGFVPNSRHLKHFEQGDASALFQFHKEQESAFEACLDRLRQTPRDWSQYLELLQATHSKVCGEWYNEFYGVAIDKDLDPAFTYEKAMAGLNAVTVAKPLSPV